MATKTRTRTKTRSPNTPAEAPPADPVLAYAKAVLSGAIVAGPHVRNACHRHLDDLERGAARGLHWDLAASTRALEFFPDILRLNGGQFEGKPFELDPSQAFRIGSLFGWKRGDGLRRFRRFYDEEGKGNGKALALDTPIPTPTGWSTMGDLEVGDFVLDERGRPNRILAATEVMLQHDCYAVTFDDGQTIIADADHLWITEKRVASAVGERRATFGVPKVEWGAWRRGQRTTREIAETLRYANGKYLSANHSVQLAEPLDLPPADLPIEPFVLGVWLGDGDSDCARFTCADNDNETVHNLRVAGCIVGPRKGQGERSGRYRLGSIGAGRGASLNAALRAAGLLDNKHIPAPYLRASVVQRLALLQGLMDTDGYINPASGQCEFTATNERLALQFRELAHTLGLKTGLHEGDATLNGRVVSRKWRVTFNPPADLSVFRLSRKLAHQRARHGRRRLSADRRIISCAPVASVPVRCISVASSSHLYLAGRSMVPTHNSPLSAGIGLYGLIADGEDRAEIYAAGKDKDQAMVLFRDAVAMVDQSPALTSRIKQSGQQPSVWNLAFLERGSFFRPISKEGGRSGPRPHLALCDEVHEHPDGAVIDMLERGFKFRRQPLLVMTTNSGSDRQSVCWQEHVHAIRAAAGNRLLEGREGEDLSYLGDADSFAIYDDTFAFVCSLDDGDDPLEDPSCWPKVNPLLNRILTEDYLAGVVRQAKAIPGKANSILRLHFCVWTDADRAWMARGTLEQCLGDFDPAQFSGERICAGANLSGSQDLTALAYVCETGSVDLPRERTLEDGSVVVETVRLPTFHAWCDTWTPGDTLAERALRDQAPYEVWRDQGWLRAPPGRQIRLDFVAARIVEVETEYLLDWLAYDRYAYRKLEEYLDDLGSVSRKIEHPQGGKRRAAAPGDVTEAAQAGGGEAPQGLWMPGSLATLETLILEKRITIQNNPVLISAFASATTEEDPFGNRWFSKRKAVKRIDPLVSMAMAVGAITAGFEEAGPRGSIYDDAQLWAPPAEPDGETPPVAASPAPIIAPPPSAPRSRPSIYDAEW